MKSIIITAILIIFSLTNCGDSQKQKCLDSLDTLSKANQTYLDNINKIISKPNTTKEDNEKLKQLTINHQSYADSVFKEIEQKCPNHKDDNTDEQKFNAEKEAEIFEDKNIEIRLIRLPSTCKSFNVKSGSVFLADLNTLFNISEKTIGRIEIKSNNYLLNKLWKLREILTITAKDKEFVLSLNYLNQSNKKGIDYTNYYNFTFCRTK